jgi:hypothetical protein
VFSVFQDNSAAVCVILDALFSGWLGFGRGGRPGDILAQGVEPMMRNALWLPLAGLLVLLLAVPGASVRGETDSPRQYYGPIQKHPRHSYSYRAYYYKPSADYAGYKHHYAMYYPSKPKYIYFYNPYKKEHWGRCPVKCEGKPLYSMLAEKDRKQNIDDIDEEAFPPPKDVPPIPESKDGKKLELPPDDLPSSTALPGK